MPQSHLAYISELGVKMRSSERARDLGEVFTPEGTGTKITWAMQSKKPFIGKIVGLFMDCEKMCGDQFLQGLASLKKVAEAAPKA